VARLLVLFARDPERQAREKGLRAPGAGQLFLQFARGWARTAEGAGARLAVATPPEDRPAWRRALAGTSELGWIDQRGDSLGARLEDVARRAAALCGRAVIVGGDVPPAPASLLEAFSRLESGADAAISPAPDGGVSLLALSSSDLDLLRGIRAKRRTVLRDLLRALSRRGRRVALLRPAADVDGRRSLRALLRRVAISAPLRELIRDVLRFRVAGAETVPPPPRPRALSSPSDDRAPPFLRAA